MPWPFFGGKRSGETREEAAERERRDAESRAALEKGGLPLRATERLTHKAASGKTLWTSNLSLDDALALDRLGYEPLEHIMGASIYHVAYNADRTGQWRSGDVAALSHAMYAARDLALGRLLQEAILLGAHGVVDVRIEERAYEWGNDLLDVVANGTAVRLRGGRVPPLERPFVANLPAQDVLALLRQGYMPMQVAMGFAAYYQVTGWDDERTMRSWLGSSMNLEMTTFSRAMSMARHIAMDRMRTDAAEHGARGVVGSNVEYRMHEIRVMRTPPWSNESETIEDHLVRFIALGTAIVQIAPPTRGAGPLPVLWLDGLNAAAGRGVRPGPAPGGTRD